MKLKTSKKVCIQITGVIHSLILFYVFHLTEMAINEKLYASVENADKMNGWFAQWTRCIQQKCRPIYTNFSFVHELTPFNRFPELNRKLIHPSFTLSLSLVEILDCTYDNPAAQWAAAIELVKEPSKVFVESRDTKACWDFLARLFELPFWIYSNSRPRTLC
jgi:hypothetical protein